MRSILHWEDEMTNREERFGVEAGVVYLGCAVDGLKCAIVLGSTTMKLIFHGDRGSQDGAGL